jgi:hypothetical protein
MTSDEDEKVATERVTLVEGELGYNILVDGERAGSIEGTPGQLEYIVIDVPKWEGCGVARAAVQSFVNLSRAANCETVTISNTTHPAAAHILETEGFEQSHDDKEWIKQL